MIATFFGDHRWDDQLAHYAPRALESQHQELQESLAQFEQTKTAEFSLDARIDHTLIVQSIKSFIRDYERTQGHLRNPGVYVDEVLNGLFMLTMKESIPLPDRLRSALGRAREAPRVLREGQQNLDTAMMPGVWIETALEQAQQAPALLSGLLPSLAAAAAPELEADLTKAGRSAGEAIQVFIEFLQDALPLATGDYAAGQDLFDEKLREEHMVSYDAVRLLEIGWEQFNGVKEQMAALAQAIDPNRSARELLDRSKSDHPMARDLLTTYEEAMADARQYVLDHDIVTIPKEETLRIIETPSYMCPIVPYAAYIAPGIFDKDQKGLFLVTPVNPNASPDEQEQQLRGHNLATLRLAAVHEAYPGHHLQLVWANRHRSIPRRLASFLSPLFVEGWAFYCEELMEQLGHISEPIQRLERLSAQLWRAARIILDVSLHTRGMTPREAVEFLVRECGLEPSNAVAEVRRYTQTPTKPQSYLMGKLAILEIVGDYRRAHPGTSLQKVHDTMLGCGSLPPLLMRQRLGL